MTPAAALRLVERVDLIDLYADRRTYRITLRAPDRTLTAEEIAAATDHLRTVPPLLHLLARGNPRVGH